MTDTAKPPTDSPKIPGKEPIFRHLDDPDMKWQKVRRQRNADGTEGTVIEKWFAFSPDPQYLSLYAIYSPGMIVRRPRSNARRDSAATCAAEILPGTGGRYPGS